MNHQAKKKFGQNFLRDKNLLMKIVRESNIENKHVLEVGPGQGALTTFLASQAIDVIAYEIDESLKPILNEIQRNFPNLTVKYEDTPILFKLLETKKILTASLMIQKEVCNRLLATPNNKEYNALSIILQYHAVVSKMMDVKRHMFYPVPNVDSAVIRIVKRDYPLLDEQKEVLFLSLVKEAFRQKRKTLVNNWFEAFSVPKEKLIQFLEMNGYSKDVRAEALTKEDFIKLTKVWNHD